MKNQYPLLILTLAVASLCGCNKQKSDATVGRHIPIESALEADRPLSSNEINEARVLSNASDNFVRAKALNQLSFVKDESNRVTAIAILKDKINDSDWLVRHAALNGLRRLKYDKLKQVATSMLNDPSDKVREAASSILANLR